MEKYEFTEETLDWKGKTLHRIRALRDFGDVKAGDIGCWIEKEKNLSHNGDCWIYDSAKVYGSAIVCDSAKICDSTKICGSAKVYDSTKICGSACINSDRDYMIINPIGSRNGATTAFRTLEGTKVQCGCFYGSISEFEEKVKETHGDNQYAKEYLAFIELLKVRFKDYEN